MRSILRLTGLVLCSLVVGGCASYVQVVPSAHETVTYEQGTPIVSSDHNSSSVVLKPTYTSYQKGNRIGFYIGIQNNSKQSIDVGMDDVHAVGPDDQALVVHTYDSRMKEIKRAQMWAAIGAGMQAASESMAASQSAYSTSTTSGSVNSYGSYGSSYGTYSGTTTTYDPAKAAAAQAQVNENNRQRINDIAAATNSASAKAELLLRRTTIGPDQFHTATILIDEPQKTPSAFHIAVNVAGEVHVFDFSYEKYEH